MACRQEDIIRKVWFNTQQLAAGSLIDAHGYASNHKLQLMHDDICGCFFCLAIFNPSELDRWVPGVEGTAICPYCGIDSIIGKSSGYPIEIDFLERMREYWFSPAKSPKLDP